MFEWYTQSSRQIPRHYIRAAGPIVTTQAIQALRSNPQQMPIYPRL